MKTMEYNLCGEWQLAVLPHGEHKNYTSRAQVVHDGVEILKAQVPGTVELDLRAAGKVDDLFFGTNPDKIRRYTERLHCYYFRTFTVDRVLPRPQLRFEGLDCYAEVFVNGISVGNFDNMLIEHTADISAAVRPGENELFIHIKPAVIEALQYDYNFTVTAGKTAYEQLYVRKPAHMYGWDIMPRYVSAGIWRPVSLRFQTQEEGIEEFYLCTAKAGRDGARLELFYKTNCEITGDVRLTLQGCCGDSRISQEIKMIFPIGRREIRVSEPKLWWPNNFGPQDMYDWELCLSRDGQIIESIAFTQGIAHVTLDRTDTSSDADGRFRFIVNGEPIFIKGTNWVPASPFHSEDIKRIPAMLDLAAEAGCNMIRCWGGNVYENDLFYELCDRKGIMIWQDFGMACGKHPQDDAFCERIRTEAVAVVKRLRSHVSLALWSGDNEGDLRWKQWESIKMNPNDNRVTRVLLPQVLMMHDPARSYLPSSPFISQPLATKAEDDWSISPPENHFYIWDGFYKDGAAGKKRMLFASEFGTICMPSPESMRRYISPEKLWTGKDINDEWLMHCTSPVPETRENLFRPLVPFMYAENLFEGEVSDLKDLAMKSQIAASECDKYYFELFRSQKWRKTGMLWWNLIDGWPQLSDAVVDCYYDKKLPFYGLQASQQDVCIMVRDAFEETTHPVVLVNDTLERKSITFRIIDVTTDTLLAAGTAVAPANSAIEIARLATAAQVRFLLLEWSGDASGKNHYLDYQKEKPKLKLADYMAWLERSGLYGEWVDKTRAW